MEADNEISGIGNHYTTEFRELDPRLGGRWWSRDPIVKPWESPYAGFANNPIYYADPTGLDAESRAKRHRQKTGVGTVEKRSGVEGGKYDGKEYWTWDSGTLGKDGAGVATKLFSDNIFDRAFKAISNLIGQLEFGFSFTGGNAGNGSIDNTRGEVPKNIIEVSLDGFEAFNFQLGKMNSPIKIPFASKPEYSTQSKDIKPPTGPGADGMDKIKSSDADEIKENISVSNNAVHNYQGVVDITDKQLDSMGYTSEYYNNYLLRDSKGRRLTRDDAKKKIN